MTHEEECNQVSAIIKGTAEKQARQLVGTTLLNEAPADQLDGVVEAQVEAFRAFLAEHGIDKGDAATATGWYHTALVRECARIARIAFYEARAALASGSFDGFSQGAGAQQVAQALPPPSIPAAPSGAVQRVAGAVQSVACGFRRSRPPIPINHRPGIPISFRPAFRFEAGHFEA